MCRNLHIDQKKKIPYISISILDWVEWKLFSMQILLQWTPTISSVVKLSFLVANPLSPTKYPCPPILGLTTGTAILFYHAE